MVCASVPVTGWRRKAVLSSGCCSDNSFEFAQSSRLGNELRTEKSAKLFLQFAHARPDNDPHQWERFVCTQEAQNLKATLAFESEIQNEEVRSRSRSVKNVLKMNKGEIHAGENIWFFHPEPTQDSKCFLHV